MKIIINRNSSRKQYNQKNRALFLKLPFVGQPGLVKVNSHQSIAIPKIQMAEKTHEPLLAKKHFEFVSTIDNYMHCS